MLIFIAYNYNKKMLGLLPVDVSYPIVAHFTLSELMNFDFACTPALTSTAWAEWVKMGLTCSSAEITTKAEQSWCKYRGISVIDYAMVSTNNNRSYVTWKRNGKLHHLHQPAYVVEYVDLFRLEYWYKEGKLHREGGPAVVSTLYRKCFPSNEKMNKTTYLWYKHGVQIKEPSKYK
jgi:hypothetical protein